MVPKAYSTPLILAFQIGLPNQIAKRSIFNPRQRAARKWPNSCTKMSKLKSNSTSREMKTYFKIVMLLPKHPKTHRGERKETCLSGHREVLDLRAGSRQAMPRFQPQQILLCIHPLPHVVRDCSKPRLQKNQDVLATGH